MLGCAYNNTEIGWNGEDDVNRKRKCENSRAIQNESLKERERLPICSISPLTFLCYNHEVE